MNHSLLPTLGAVLLLAAGLPGAAVAQAPITREFRYASERFTLTDHEGFTRIRVRGAQTETAPGRPDLPRIGERVELPPGFRVAEVEVTALETEPLARGIRVSPAPRIEPGEAPLAYTTPDPALYGRSGFQPEVPVRIGTQGFERERAVVYLIVTPVRWDAVSGRLERVSRLEVRLRLEPTAARPLRRERVVPDWEGGAPVAGARVAPATLAPAPRGAQPFRPTQLPSVLGSPVAYVIVTGDSLAAGFQPLAEWKTQTGLPAVVRTLGTIRQEYPFGADDAERIRMFIRDAYERWGTVWVLLGGDTDVLPTRITRTLAYGSELIPCDLYFSSLEGTWNADGDSLWGEGYINATYSGDNADLLPEVWVGRAPVSTPADVARFVEKTLTYELTPVSDYMKNWLFFAEVLFPQYWSPGQSTVLDGAELIDYDLLPWLDTAPWLHVVRMYENYLDPRWRPGALRESRIAVIDSLERGYNVAVHVGHGYRTVMSCSDGNVSNNDVFGLTNGNRLINVYATNCTSNAIDYQSVGEAFIRAPNGGAVTNIGSTRFDFPVIGRDYEQEYFRLVIQDSVTAVGEAQARQKLPFVGDAFFDNLDRWTQLTLLLLGDPELRIYTNTPRFLVVTAPNTMLVSDSTISVNVTTGGQPLYGARVTAYMPDRDYRSATTDGAGNVVLPFRPDSLGALVVTVTAFNARPYQKVVSVLASTEAALTEQPPLVVDTPGSGRIGNSDGHPDAGEVFDLRVAVRNAGGANASNVNGTLTTTDGLISIPTASVGYGSISAGAVSNPAGGFRISVPANCPDQREVPFRLDLVTANGKHWNQSFRLVVRAPELVHRSHAESESPGNGNGLPEPGETVTYTFRIRNLGTGQSAGVYGRLRNHDGLATVLDSALTVGTLDPGIEAEATPVRFVPTSPTAKLSLLLYDGYGLETTQTLDIGYPTATGNLLAKGGQGKVDLTWRHSAAPDLAGYNLYRSTGDLGPWLKVTPNPIGRGSTCTDIGLTPLTLYSYKVAVVDSSGNESALTSPVSVTTNPALHAGFPTLIHHSTPAPVTVEHASPGYPLDIVAGANVLYLVHPDGTAPVDADGLPETNGDLSTVGEYFAGGGSISDLDGDGTKEIIGGAWNSQQLCVFDLEGNDRPGFPASIQDQMWSAVAVGDLDGDGSKEMVFASRSDLSNGGKAMYAFRANGAEWMDGDSNPATLGVFRVMGYNFNHATPALADLLGNGQKEVVYGSFDGKLYAWKPDGSNAPGFPVIINAPMSASPAVGSLDGPGGPLSIVIPASNDSLYVFGPNGARRSGFPKWMATTGTNRTPSPALADMDQDDTLDVVVATTEGWLHVFDGRGNAVTPWLSRRYSSMFNYASEASPVVADINGDGKPDVVIGDEVGELTALSGVDGLPFPGFPIRLDAEASGTPALCDCDGDGLTEIVAADYGRSLLVWDYDFPFSPGGAPPWPQFMHDAERTGNATTPILLDVDPIGARAPRAVALAAPWPNPARRSFRLEYGVPLEEAGQPYEIAIYDLGGRRLRTIERGIARAGRHDAAWDLRDDRGATAAPGVYFARLRVGMRAAVRKVVVIR